MSCEGIEQPQVHDGYRLSDELSAETVKDVRFITEDETSVAEKYLLPAANKYIWNVEINGNVLVNI